MHFSTRTTDELERYAKRIGYALTVVRAVDNASGRYFATGDSNGPWVTWKSLGWSELEARNAIQLMVHELYCENEHHYCSCSIPDCRFFGQ